MRKSIQWLIALVVVLFSGSLYAGYLMYMPFENGETWYCPQGNNESFSHYGKLAYGYDFIFWGDDSFGKTVVSPVNGVVVDAVSDIEDYEYNDGDYDGLNNNGFGNTLLLRDNSTGMYVRLCHFRQGSLLVDVGDTVDIGEEIAQVGQSGFSTDPHVHVHVQAVATGFQSVPFSFVEGPIETGDVVESELAPDSFVIDDTSDKSLSHAVSSYSTSNSGNWNITENPSPNSTVGRRKFSKKLKNTGPVWYKWNFKLKSSGLYAVYAKVSHSSYNDPDAKYTLKSSTSSKIESTSIVQQNVSEYQDWSLVFFTTLSSTKTYTIQVTGQTYLKYTKADALMFVRLW